MAEEAVVRLVRDLTGRLSAIAEEFGTRADELVRTHPDGNDDAAARDLVAIAELLLDQRARRAEHLPADLFHEPAWDMLLALFIAQERRQTMNVKSLVACASAPVTTSQRWIDHLHKLRLIERVTDPEDRRRIEVSLSEAGTRSMCDYLRTVPLR